jgi:mRNA-degrading endonuclease toxin of MazEF toxin-antitoxin module
MRALTPDERGHVVLVGIAFSDGRGLKQRPAVVWSTSAYNDDCLKLVVIGLASNTRQPYRFGDTHIEDLGTAGLSKPCMARGVLATVDRAAVRRVLGRLAPVDLERVESNVAAILGFRIG